MKVVKIFMPVVTKTLIFFRCLFLMYLQFLMRDIEEPTICIGLIKNLDLLIISIKSYTAKHMSI